MASALAPFADIEAMVNQATASALANALATFNGGQPFPVLFDRQGTQPFGEAVDAVSARAGFELRHAPGLVRGSVLVIGGASYRLDSDAEPDATGWVEVSMFPVAGGGA